MDLTLFLRDIGRNVRFARTAAGITQSELAASAGVSERLIRSVENGEARNVSIGRLVSILNRLGLDLRVGGDEPTGVPITQDPGYSDLLQRAVASWNCEE